MIFVILGGTESAQDAIAHELMNNFKSRAQRLNLSHITHGVQRFRRLRQELRHFRPQGAITIIHGIGDPHEVAACRSAGAFITHIYGVLNPMYADVPICASDVQICAFDKRQTVPSHVLTVCEAVSLCDLRASQAAAKRRQHGRREPRPLVATA